MNVYIYIDQLQKLFIDQINTMASHPDGLRTRSSEVLKQLVSNRGAISRHGTGTPRSKPGIPDVFRSLSSSMHI